jgi:hypothetical protein
MAIQIICESLRDGSAAGGGGGAANGGKLTPRAYLLLATASSSSSFSSSTAREMAPNYSSSSQNGRVRIFWRLRLSFETAFLQSHEKKKEKRRTFLCLLTVCIRLLFNYSPIYFTT